MITMPGKFTYLFTPRTASRATEAALRTIPGAEDSGKHHDDPRKFTEDQMTLPMYATIRNPFTQVLSWYWGWKGSISFERFLASAQGPGRRWAKQRLNVYDPWVDRYFVYEDGIPAILEGLGYTDIEVPEIGVSGVDPDFMTPERRILVADLFDFDIDLYSRVVDGYRLYQPSGQAASHAVCQSTPAARTLNAPV